MVRGDPLLGQLLNLIQFQSVAPFISCDTPDLGVRGQVMVEGLKIGIRD